MSIKEFLKAETEHLGFPISGITNIGAPLHLSTFQDWIKAGKHAGMGYLAHETSILRRANPHLIQPGAQSLLMVGLRYPSPGSLAEEPLSEARGRVAAYAWGEDYHEVIPALLNELILGLEKYLGRSIQSRLYTDTGAILERDFAQNAGLGWAGKNTCLIHPRQGSYFLLGEVFIPEELEPDLPFRTDHCGTCRRCIDSCPTEAILADRTIDSNKCISYLTIENKGSIPVELRPSIGNWIFGCDICQEVCPWNRRFSTPDGHPALKSSPELARPNLQRELALSPQEFNRKFKRSPIRRAKRRGYLRNVAVALGNLADTNTIPVLGEALANDPEPLVRGHAAWALGRMNTPAARQKLEIALIHEPDPQVRVEVQSALEQ